MARKAKRMPCVNRNTRCESKIHSHLPLDLVSVVIGYLSCQWDECKSVCSPTSNYCECHNPYTPKFTSGYCRKFISLWRDSSGRNTYDVYCGMKGSNHRKHEAYAMKLFKDSPCGDKCLALLKK